MNITDDSSARKGIPLARGFFDYFPAAIAEVARLSQAGNDKHNPGEEMHHARGKSNDHADCILRHLVDRGCVDTDGFLHEVKVAWRALALLQESLEARGATLARGARLPEPTVSYDEELDRIAEALDVAIEPSDYDFKFPIRIGTPPTFSTPFVFIDELEFDEYGRFVGEPVEPFTFTDEELEEMRAVADGFPATPEPESVVDSLYCSNAISNRIAGDSAKAKSVKNPYYNHDPFEIRGYCAECDKELTVDDESVEDPNRFEKGILFCSLRCLDKLLAFQGRSR